MNASVQTDTNIHMPSIWQTFTPISYISNFLFTLFVMHQWISEEEPGTGPLVLSKQNSKYKNLVFYMDHLLSESGSAFSFISSDFFFFCISLNRQIFVGTFVWLSADFMLVLNVSKWQIKQSHNALHQKSSGRICWTHISCVPNGTPYTMHSTV